MNHRPARSIETFSDQPLTRRAMAKQRTRERLLDAARKLFAERGYEAATVRDIAAAADLSTGAVFASFSDKADLFTEVIVADFQTFNARMSEIDVTGCAVRESLMAIFGAAYRCHLEQLGLMRAAMSFSWQRDAESEARSRQAMKLLLSLLSNILAAGMKSGELSDKMDLRLTTEIVWDCYLANYRRAIFDDWDADALSLRLAAQIDVVLAGFRTAA